ncbi:MAG: type II secretion system protein M [Pseudomonadales bacterium]
MSLGTSLGQRFASSGIGRWYAGRERGEQRVIAVLTAAIVLTVVWLGVWKPLSDWRTVETNRFQNAQGLLDWMHANEARAREIARAGTGSPGGRRSLLPILTRSAEAQGIALNRLQPEANDVVSVVIQAQPFNEVLRWLHQLQENNGVSVLRVSIDAEGQPGLINAQIRLQ